MKLEVRQVGWSVEQKRIIQNISLEVQPRQFVGLIGPNGSGKSSLLKTIYRILKPDTGMVAIDEQDVWQLSPREVAQSMAVVIQESLTEFDFTAREIVMMGRLPFKKTFETESEYDLQLTEEALRQVDLLQLADRHFLSLSGGEKQRLLIARALAQQPQLLLMDEPTNHLDIYHQLEILDLIKQLRITALVALHDLNLAAFYCDHIYVLKEGRVVSEGVPQTILTPRLIEEVYGVYAEVRPHPRTGKLHITFFPQRMRRGGFRFTPSLKNGGTTTINLQDRKDLH